MPNSFLEIMLDTLDKSIIPSMKLSDPEDNVITLRNYELILPHGFYIDYPGTKQARDLYQIAADCARHQKGDAVTNGDIWKILMPRLFNTETACRFPLPDYDGRRSLILSNNKTHLLSIPEMAATCEADATLHSLPNLHTDACLTFSELEQIRVKDYNLWSKYNNREEPWLSERTLANLIFLSNIALSTTTEIDDTFESRFETALSENEDFKRYYLEYFHPQVLSAHNSDAKELMLTCCYKYFEYYLKTLAPAEQAAFMEIQLENRNLYESLIQVNINGLCMTQNALKIAKFAFALTGEKNIGNWKYNLISRHQSNYATIFGTLKHLVKNPADSALEMKHADGVQIFENEAENRLTLQKTHPSSDAPVMDTPKNQAAEVSNSPEHNGAGVVGGVDPEYDPSFFGAAKDSQKEDSPSKSSIFSNQ